MYNFAAKVYTYYYISPFLGNLFFRTMKKYLLLVALSMLSQLSSLNAQTLFRAPDTVCVRQPITLSSVNDTAANYYWGFCSGSISYAPGGVNMGSAGFGLHTPSNIDIIQDVDGKYYGFVLNAGTDEFLRYNFGTNLNSIPTVTNFGNLTNGLPHHPTSLYIAYDALAKKWFIFVSGGYTASESTLGRIDFDASLSNPAPNIANFGNLNGAFDGPKGVFVAKDVQSDQWFGYLVNRNNNQLIRLEFSFNISNTPKTTNCGNPNSMLNTPADMAAIKDNGMWYLFVVNRSNNLAGSVGRFDLGTTLDTTITAIQGTNLGNFNSRVLVPSSICLTRDCGSIYAYITDSTTSQLISLQMPYAVGPYFPVDYSVVGGMNYPSGISNIIRDHDNLFSFITNVYDSTLTKIQISSCTNSSIPSFSEVTPPEYYYNDTGWFNIYYVINQGLPDMQVECKQIRVQPIPNILLPNNPIICRGDSIHLYAISNYADSFAWSPVYNLDTFYNHTDSVKAWPDYTTTYNLTIHYPDGCIVDTFVKVNVVKVIADAGPDRTIADGAATMLGGPATSLGFQFSYVWTPTLYLPSFTDPFPTATPTTDYTYVLTVTEDSTFLHCHSSDTVVVHVNCGDFNVPNAFTPNSENPLTNRFGILNREVSQLNYFRIYDRWGVLMFSTTDITNAWDGTYNGVPQPVGVYVWEADGFCTSGKAIKKHGNVTLLR